MTENVLKVRAAEILTIDGFTGSGKSTYANAIFNDFTSLGRSVLLIDGINSKVSRHDGKVQCFTSPHFRTMFTVGHVFDTVIHVHDSTPNVEAVVSDWPSRRKMISIQAAS